MAPETQEKHVNWKQWLGCTVATQLLLTGVLLAVQLTIDPFGVWSTSPTPGLNNQKTGQAGTERLFKIYQYELIKPEVVFLGNSRGAWGLPPRWNGAADGKVYNLAFDAQRVGDAQRLVRLMMRHHHPRTIVLNLDTIMMTNTAFDPRDWGGFDERIRTASRKPFGLQVAKLRDTVFSFDALWQSYAAYQGSGKYPEARAFYENGWYTVKGEQQRPQAGEYREHFWRYFTSLHKIVFPAPSSLFALQRIVELAKHFGVELVVSFSPITADHLLSIEARGRTHGLEQIKEQIVERTPFWDFAYVNSVTTNRYNFIDSVHYRGVTGEKMLRRMSGSPAAVPSDFGVLVTRENIDSHLEMARKRLEGWRTRHASLFDMLKDATKHGDKAKFEAELKRIVPVAR